MIKETVENKTPDEHIEFIRTFYEPNIRNIIDKANTIKLPYKGTMRDYQAAWLYVLARQYNKPELNILEIGTGKGYSTSYIAMACPNAHITTISIRADEQLEASQNLSKLALNNVDYVTVETSWDYLEELKTIDVKLDMVFVDGDHNRVKRDLGYWDILRDNGLFLFHDYCPTFAANPQPIVYAELNAFKDRLPRKDFDIKLIDNDHIGMVGLYK